MYISLSLYVYVYNMFTYLTVYNNTSNAGRGVHLQLHHRVTALSFIVHYIILQ